MIERNYEIHLPWILCREAVGSEDQKRVSFTTTSCGARGTGLAMAKLSKTRGPASAVQDADAPANAPMLAKRLGVRQSAGTFTSRAPAQWESLSTK
jgi:hypothetical protein